MTVGKRLITEGFNAADNSSIVPVILPIALDSCQNSVVGEVAGGKLASCKGFFRLNAEEFCENAMPQLNELYSNPCRSRKFLPHPNPPRSRWESLRNSQMMR